MKVSLIVATDQKQGIGKNNDLMWHLPADMKFFKETTMGHIVVMGRKNYESIPEKFRPLPGRVNAVLTRNEDYQAEGCLVFHSLEECLRHFSKGQETVFIIGGGEIYRQALEQECVEEMYITEVAHTFDADTFFPELDDSKWKGETIAAHPKDEKNKYDFIIRKYSIVNK